MWGRIQYQGRSYIERMHTYPAVVTLTALQKLVSRITMDGEAAFLLKYLCSSSTGTFRFRLGNSDQSTVYSSSGVGGTNDRVLNTLMFGNAQFPFPVIPFIMFTKSGSLIMDLEDTSNSGNTLEFAFHGSKLIPED